MLSRGAMQLVLDRAFSDMESYAAVIVGWELDFRQLDRGCLRARARLFTGDRGAILRVGFDRAFHQVGLAPESRLVFGLPDSNIRWCGIDAAAGSLINFNQPAGFDGVSQAGFTGHVLMFERQALRDAAAELGREVDLRALGTQPVWHASGVTEALRRRLRTELSSPLGEVANTRAREHLDVASLLTVAGSVTGDGPSPRVPDRALRRTTVRLAIELLEDANVLPLSVADLCRAVGVSPPTLYRAFVAELGVSPKRYIQSRTLSGVRTDLLSAPAGVTVSDIANRWGFWHMGQFASDYRRQFGELPSESLARS